MAEVSLFMIGADLGSLVNVENLDPALCPPRATPPGLSQRIEVADGNAKGVGWTACAWVWDYLEPAEYNLLKTYCPNTSSVVVIQTKKEDGTYGTFNATMIWPPGPTRELNVWRDITIEFRKMTVT